MDDIVNVESRLRSLVQSAGLSIVNQGQQREICVAQPHEQSIVDGIEYTISVLKAHSKFELIFEMMYTALVTHLVQDIAASVTHISCSNVAQCLSLLENVTQACERYRSMPILTIFQQFVERHEAFQLAPMTERRQTFKWMRDSVIWEFVSACKYEMTRAIFIMICLIGFSKKKVSVNDCRNSRSPNNVLKSICQALLSLPLCFKSCEIYKDIFTPAFQAQNVLTME